MSKEEILDVLSSMEWTEEMLSELEVMVSSFVVYQQDPDDYTTYCYKYYVSEKDAYADFDSRDFVPCGRWCYAIIASLNDSSVRERRIVSLGLRD